MSDAALTPDHPAPRELVVVARDCLRAGGTLDEAAQAVLARTASPIEAIKALLGAQPGLSLGDAKPVVHRNLPPRVQKAAEQLWVDLERSLLEIADKQ